MLEETDLSNYEMVSNREHIYRTMTIVEVLSRRGQRGRIKLVIYLVASPLPSSRGIGCSLFSRHCQRTMTKRAMRKWLIIFQIYTFTVDHDVTYNFVDNDRQRNCRIEVDTYYEDIYRVELNFSDHSE